MKPINILIYEDHTDLRNLLSELLNAQDNIAVIGAFATCNNCFADVQALDPDIIIMDIDMPGINGIEGVQLAKSAKPTVQILMHTVFDNHDKIFKSIENGANGYLLKSDDFDELLNAISVLHSGGGIMSPSIAVKMLSQFRELHNPHKNEREKIKLNERETQILQLLVEGSSYKTIASQIFLSVDTVRFHIKNIYNKLHVNSASEAVSKALRLKIVE